MFDQTFVDTHAQTRKPLTVGISLAIQTGIVAVVLIVPLLHPEILHPKLDAPLFFVALKQLKPQPPVEARTSAPPAKSAHRVFTAPARVPERIANVVDLTSVAAPPDSLGIAGPEFSIGPGAAFPGLGANGIPGNPPPPLVKPAAQKPPSSAGPIKVSLGVQNAKLIFGPKPVYPPLARASRTQGTVRLQAVIGEDGIIENLQVTNGPPLLQKAALDAVRQWRYQPTLLSGKAVEVLTEIDVIFTLN